MLGKERASGHPALTDPVTGLANHLHFDLVYGYLFGAADRGVALTVLSIQVDGLEGADDGPLGAVGGALLRVTRSSDLPVHVSGGRFLVLLVGANVQGGLLVADRVETAMKGVAPGTLSCGLAAYAPEMKEPSQLLDAAGAALEKAVGSGGGVEIARD